MKRIDKLLLFTSVSIVFLLLSPSCKGVGIFAYIATTEKIDRGLLPKGIGASGILHIENEYAASNYDYFSTGSALYRKNTVDRTENSPHRWSTVSLPSGWTNIQSVAASENKLLLALSKASDTSSSVGIFSYTDSSGFISISENVSVLSSSSSYNTLLLFCPNPAAATDTFYVNILNYSGTFGKESTFTGSQLYLLDDAQTQITASDKASGTWTTTLESSYISGAAYSGNTYRFTTISPDSNGPSGVLVDETGKEISGIITDTELEETAGSPSLPSGSLTWLPNLNAYIMSSITTSAGSYHIYISTDGGIGNDWKILSSGYYITSFLDVSNTLAGGNGDPTDTDAYSPPNKLVLAGTRSTLSWNSGYGYLEIVAGETARSIPQEWTLRTSKSTFTFAQSNSYIAGDLSSTGIVALTLLREGSSNNSGDQYVYASTYNSGIWRLNADDNSSLLANTLIWKGE